MAFDYSLDPISNIVIKCHTIILHRQVNRESEQKVIIKSILLDQYVGLSRSAIL